MTEPVRVGQILNRMDSGGIEAMVMNYCRHIDRKRVKLDFYFDGYSALPQRAELEQMGAGLYPLPPYTRLAAYHRALYTAFQNRRYDIVHAHLSTMSPFPLFAAWRAGVPVRICHNHSTACRSEGIRTLLKYILRPFGPLFATHLFACGETAGRWMYGNRRFAQGEVVVLPNAIETESFVFDPAARTRLREAFHIPKDVFVLGHIGRFVYQKNHAFLLDVFAALRKRRPDARLLLVGEGEKERAVRRRARAMGLEARVIFTGARKDVGKLYSVMDAFCLPSYYEGMPLTAWEAQANGLPCVFSDAIGAEAVRTRGSIRLPLAAGPAVWADALSAMRRMEGGASAVPGAARYAEWLQRFYLDRAKHAEAAKERTA